MALASLEDEEWGSRRTKGPGALGPDFLLCKIPPTLLAMLAEHLTAPPPPPGTTPRPSLLSLPPGVPDLPGTTRPYSQTLLCAATPLRPSQPLGACRKLLRSPWVCMVIAAPWGEGLALQGLSAAAAAPSEPLHTSWLCGGLFRPPIHSIQGLARSLGCLPRASPSPGIRARPELPFLLSKGKTASSQARIPERRARGCLRTQESSALGFSPCAQGRRCWKRC